MEAVQTLGRAPLDSCGTCRRAGGIRQRGRPFLRYLMLSQLDLSWLNYCVKGTSHLPGLAVSIPDGQHSLELGTLVCDGGD